MRAAFCKFLVEKLRQDSSFSYTRITIGYDNHACMYCRLVFRWYLHYTKLFQRNGWFQTAFYAFSVLQSICDLCIFGSTFPRMYDQWTTVWKRNIFARTFYYSVVKNRFCGFVCIIWCSGLYGVICEPAGLLGLTGNAFMFCTNNAHTHTLGKVVSSDRRCKIPKFVPPISSRHVVLSE